MKVHYGIEASATSIIGDESGSVIVGGGGNGWRITNQKKKQKGHKENCFLHI